MRLCTTVLLTACCVLSWGRPAPANVFTMPAGQASLQFVPVGNPGNVADTRYSAYVRGAVGYAYNIGKCEITAGQYCEFLNAVDSGPDPFGPYHDSLGLYADAMWSDPKGCKIREIQVGSNTYSYSVAPEYANRPVNCVTWANAARFCNWLANGQPKGTEGQPNTTEDGSYVLQARVDDGYLMTVTRKPNARYVIPTEDEWYKAAYYDPNKNGVPGYWNYPTRSDTQPGRDLTEATSAGNNANYIGTPYPLEAGTYYTTSVGQFSLSLSPYGTFDQGGNVYEWTDTAWGSDRRFQAGGAFNATGGDIRASSYYGGTPSDGGVGVGFRIVEVPEPATLSLLAMAVLAMRRRRQ